MPKNSYMQVIAKNIEDVKKRTKDECWARTARIIDLLMIAVTVHLNDKCGLGRERIMRVNEAMKDTLTEFAKTDDEGYFMHCLERDYKRIMGDNYKNMPGVELEVEW